MPEPESRTEVELSGCTPEPLISYLKALGVLRLVVEQEADPAATLSWKGGVARLRSRLERDDLVRFFVEDYQPTPIVTPWNSASGFAPTKPANKSPKDKSARDAIKSLEDSQLARLAPYKSIIQQIRQVVRGDEDARAWKHEYVLRCRSCLSDSMVPWLDTCFALTDSNAVTAPLLGSGGNDGVAEFGSLFMQRICDVIIKMSAERSRRVLLGSLFGGGYEPLSSGTIGQFSPGQIGGPNGTQRHFGADSCLNAWDFVLMMEGAILFAGSVARRLGSRMDGRAMFPFSVESVAVGYGSATAGEETTNSSRAELWLPLWDDLFTLAEVRYLVGEGRAQLGRRQARNAVEFALAACLLGVSRGVKSFARYGFLRRSGRNYFATPLGRVEVALRPRASLLLDRPVVHWVDAWRRACRDKEKTPTRYQAALRRVDRAMFAFANRSGRGGDAPYLRDVLASLGRAERALAGGRRFAADNHLAPLQGLSPEWLTEAGGASCREFRLAAGLASLPGIGAAVGPFRTFLEPVRVGRPTGRVEWSPESPSAVWSNRPLAENLAAVFRRRQLEQLRAGADADDTRPRRGRTRRAAVAAGPARWRPTLADVVAFLRDGTDDERLAELIWGLATLAWSKAGASAPRGPNGKPTTPTRGPVEASAPPVEDTSAGRAEGILPFEFGVLRLLAEPRRLVARRKRPKRDENTGTDAGSGPDGGPKRGRKRLKPDALEWALERPASEGATPSEADRDSGPTPRLDPRVFDPLAGGRIDAVAEAVERAVRRHWANGQTVLGRRNRQGDGGLPLVPAAAGIRPERLLAAMLIPLSDRDLCLIANRVLYPPESET